MIESKNMKEFEKYLDSDNYTYVLKNNKRLKIIKEKLDDKADVLWKIGPDGTYASLANQKIKKFGLYEKIDKNLYTVDRLHITERELETNYLVSTIDLLKQEKMKSMYDWIDSYAYHNGALLIRNSNIPTLNLFSNKDYQVFSSECSILQTTIKRESLLAYITNRNMQSFGSIVYKSLFEKHSISPKETTDDEDLIQYIRYGNESVKREFASLVYEDKRNFKLFSNAYKVYCEEEKNLEIWKKDGHKDSTYENRHRLYMNLSKWLIPNYKTDAFLDVYEDDTTTPIKVLASQILKVIENHSSIIHTNDETAIARIDYIQKVKYRNETIYAEK